MLRTCIAAAATAGSVCLFLEPIALYHTRDLYEPGDDGWLAEYPAPPEWDQRHIPIGAAAVHGDGADLTIVTNGNGLPLSLRAARVLAESDVDARVLDLRWLAPLPVDDLLVQAHATGRVLVADETRHSGGISEAVLAALIDGGFTGPIGRVTSRDSFVPLGDAARQVLLSEQDIVHAARSLVR